MKALFDFPIFEVTDDGILAANSDFSIGFEVTLHPTGSRSAEEYDAAREAHEKALNGLPPGTIVQWMDWYTYARCETSKWRSAPGKEPEDDFLKDSAQKHFVGRPYLRHRCFVFITRHMAVTPATIEKHKDICYKWQFTVQCEGAVIEAILLRKNDLEELLQQYCFHNFADENVICDVELGDRIKIGDKPCVLYSLSDADYLPANCSASVPYEPYSTEVTEYPIGFTSPIGPLLDVEHICTQLILITDKETRKAQFERQRKRARSLSVDESNAETAMAISAYLKEAAQPWWTMVRLYSSVLAWAAPSGSIDELKKKVSTAIGRLGARPHLETIATPQYWLAGIPGNGGNLPKEGWLDTFTAQASCFLTAETNQEEEYYENGFPLGQRFTGIPQNLDLSHEPLEDGWIDNRNKIVIGGSGSGKSFFLNNFVHWNLSNHSHVMIVDIGGSYRRLCQLMNGHYVTYDEKSPLSFNPFQLERKEYPDIEKVESLKVLLSTLWKKDKDNLTQAEYLTLSRAIRRFYQFIALNEGPAPSLNAFYDFVDKHFRKSLIEEHGVQHFDLDGFLYVLKPFYTGGEYDYLLNAADQPAFLDHPFLVFELDNIADHPILYPVVTIIIMQTYISKLRHLHDHHKILLIEEAWKPLMRESTSAYIKWLFKTARKFYGEIIVSTQELEDLASNPIVKNTIINNTDCKILTDCRKFTNRFYDLEKLLSLSEKEKIQALSLNKANDPNHKYKEVFIGFAKGPSNVYRNEVSLEEYLVYTTEAKERNLVDHYVGQKGGVREGVAALAADIRAGVVQLLLTAAFVIGFVLSPSQKASAQVAELVEAVTKKALVAADMKVQRDQTATIALQTTQKEAETDMQSGLLDDIASWVDQTQELFETYYQALWQVKTSISNLGKVQGLVQRQAQLVIECQRDWSTIQQDPHFSIGELSHIGQVYQAILNESSRNIQQLTLVIQSFFTQMDDGSRLQLIDETGSRIESNYGLLRKWTGENALLSANRARSQADLQSIQILYGIQ